MDLEMNNYVKSEEKYTKVIKEKFKLERDK